MFYDLVLTIDNTSDWLVVAMDSSSSMSSDLQIVVIWNVVTWEIMSQVMDVGGLALLYITVLQPILYVTCPLMFLKI